MAVSQLCRITFGFAWDGINAHFINFTGGWGREQYPEFQSLKKYSPERVVFIHIQNPGKSHRTANGLFFGKRRISKDPMILIGKQIWNIVFFCFFSQPPFTTVSGNIFSAAGKMVDCQKTMIRTFLAACQLGFKGQGMNLLNGKHRTLIICLVAFSGDQGCAESAHDSRNIRADYLTAGNLFKTAQYGVIVKSASLYYDIFSKI